MSYEEAVPGSFDTSDIESSPDPLTAEGIEAHADAHEAAMNAREADLLRTLDALQPETPDQERILAALKERTLALSGPRLDLRVAAQTAALSVALEGLLSKDEDPSPEREAYAARLLAKNPELAEMLMQRILGAPENPEHTGHGAESPQRAALTKEARTALGEMEGSDTKLFKGLALRTAERVTRALIGASTLGIGTLVYDSAKDLCMVLRERSTARTKQRLMASTAAPA
jgi:hypothetical protein